MSSRNIAFPLLDDDEKGYFLSTTKTDKDALTSNLMLLLLTEEHERFYNPEYGINLWKFVFDPSDDITETDISEYIKKKVSTYIPDLTINDISFEIDDEDENRIDVKIRFTYDDDAFSEEKEIIISNKR